MYLGSECDNPRSEQPGANETVPVDAMVTEDEMTVNRLQLDKTKSGNSHKAQVQVAVTFQENSRGPKIQPNVCDRQMKTNVVEAIATVDSVHSQLHPVFQRRGIELGLESHFSMPNNPTLKPVSATHGIIPQNFSKTPDRDYVELLAYQKLVNFTSDTQMQAILGRNTGIGQFLPPGLTSNKIKERLQNIKSEMEKQIPLISDRTKKGVKYALLDLKKLLSYLLTLPEYKALRKRGRKV